MVEEVIKTPYEWCLINRLRPLDVEKWPKEIFEDGERNFYENAITEDDFNVKIQQCGVVIENSNPRKTDKYLEYRMYGLVPYNLSTIQKGVQFGHAVVEYSEIMYNYFINSIITSSTLEFARYQKWASKDKTFIILDGGTTNTNVNRIGSLNKTLHAFNKNNVVVAEFYEPDLGDQLSAFVFLVDERVFNRELYPNFVVTPKPYGMSDERYADTIAKKDFDNYKHWVDKIGGNTNVFLRNTLQNMRLAT